MDWDLLSVSGEGTYDQQEGEKQTQGKIPKDTE